MSKSVKFPKLNGINLRIGIARARWNSEITGALFDGCRKELLGLGVKEKNIIALDVPGSYELVYGAKKLIDKNKVDAVVCIGCLIKGETMHFEYIADAVTHGIMRLNIDTGVPVIFGVLTCLNEDQAKKRSTGANNHGISWAKTAVEMALLKNQKEF